MLSSPTSKVKLLSRVVYVSLPHPRHMKLLHRSSVLFHHQYRKNRVGTKSQSRCQSTLHPPIHPDIDTASKPCSRPIFEQQRNIRTTLSTSLDDSLIPRYLEETYWWAYIHPNAVKFWERQWLVDTILWGNFNRLKQEAIDELRAVHRNNKDNALKTLNVTQIACVYGNFSTDLVSAIGKMHANGYNMCKYKIVDIAPIQLINTKNKIDRNAKECMVCDDVDVSIDLYQSDSSDLKLIPNNSEDLAYLFFLLHEQPKDVRLKTIEETIRITKRKGKIVIVDYHKPLSNINPFRYIMRPILTYLEPFAIDLWNEQITDYIEHLNEKYEWNITMEKTLYFNG
eukprot:247603_1